jgi:hypothetical protein
MKYSKFNRIVDVGRPAGASQLTDRGVRTSTKNDAKTFQCRMCMIYTSDIECIEVNKIIDVGRPARAKPTV